MNIQHAMINCSSGAVAGNVLVGATAGAKIQVLGIFVYANGAETVTFYSNPANTGTAISGAMALAANGGFVLPVDLTQTPWFETAIGQSLTLLLGTDAVQVSGWIVYNLG